MLYFTGEGRGSEYVYCFYTHANVNIFGWSVIQSFVTDKALQPCTLSYKKISSLTSKMVVRNCRKFYCGGTLISLIFPFYPFTGTQILINHQFQNNQNLANINNSDLPKFHSH